MKIGRWVPVVLWIGVILTATSVPSVPAPRTTGADKLGHFLLYFVLGVLTMRALWGSAPIGRTVAGTIAALAIFAAADEWHQRFIPRRSAEVADWIADISGASLGVAICAMIGAPRARST